MFFTCFKSVTFPPISQSSVKDVSMLPRNNCINSF